MSRRRQRRHRLFKEKILLSVLGGMAIATALAGVAVGFVYLSLSRVDRLDVAEVLTAPDEAPVTASDIVAAAPDVPGGVASAVPSEDSELDSYDTIAVHRPDRPEENYLIVGSDSVDGIGGDDVVLTDREAQAENNLADTILVVRVRPDGTAAALSVPRDLLVTIAGTNRTALINSAFNLTDQEARATRLIQTVQEALDIELQHFIEIDLDGFRRVVDALGGVEVCFDQATRDRTTDDSGDPNKGGTGFVAGAGWNRLDGERALQFVRSRHLLVETEPGRWERLGFWNDQERSARQQQFLVEVVDQALSSAVRSPNTMRQLLDVVGDHVATSNTLSLVDDGLDLARLLRDFDSSRLERYQLQLFDDEIRGVTGLSLVPGALNDRVLDVFRHIRWDDVVEERVTVTVAGPNGGLMSQDLRALGFVVTSGGGSSAASDGVPVVRYGVGGELAAVVLASHFPNGVQFAGDPELSGNDVVLELPEEDVLLIEEHVAVQAPEPVARPATSEAGQQTPAPVTADVPEAPVPVAEGICT